MLALNLCFVAMEHVCSQPFLAVPFACSVHTCPVSTDFWRTQDAREFSETPSELKVVSCVCGRVKGERGVLAAPRGLPSVQIKTCFEGRSKQWCLKRHKPPRNPALSFLIHVTSLCSPTAYAESDDVEGTGNWVWCTATFHLRPSWLIINSKVTLW